MNRYNTPVMFGLEKNIIFLYAHVVFGANGTPVLDVNNSKGIANLWYNTPTFTANTVGSSATMSSVSSFSLLYPGMVLTTPNGNALPASVTISSMTQSATNQTITLSTGTGVPTNNGAIFVASGGQYTFQFGLAYQNRFDTFYKFLGCTEEWVQTSGSATSSATQVGLIPANKASFLVRNNTQIRTIPSTLTSNSTDASLTIQYGSGTATAFLAGNPNPGDSLNLKFAFGNSTAP